MFSFPKIARTLSLDRKSILKAQVEDKEEIRRLLRSVVVSDEDKYRVMSLDRVRMESFMIELMRVSHQSLGNAMQLKSACHIHSSRVTP
jgi:hypothetical protein